MAPEFIWTGPVRYLTLLLILLCAAGVHAEPLTVFAVRHAEKLEGSDPDLSATGLRRAADLAALLGSSGIEQIWSSDYQRTRSTASPLASRIGLPVKLYDPRDLSALASRIRANGKTALVVGHSNTTPQLVRLLGGQAEDMGEWQYDRVYLLQIDDHQTRTLLLHLPPMSVQGQP